MWTRRLGAIYGPAARADFAAAIAALLGVLVFDTLPGLVIGVDVSDVALQRAKKQGADLTCRSDREDPVSFIQNATGGQGADLAIECVGRQKTIAMAVACLRVGGRAVVVGLGSEEITLMPPTEFVRREVELRGSYAFTVREIAELTQLIENGRLDISGSVSKRIPLEEINEGLEALHKKIDDPIRIVVTL